MPAPPVLGSLPKNDAAPSPNAAIAPIFNAGIAIVPITGNADTSLPIRPPKPPSSFPGFGLVSLFNFVSSSFLGSLTFPRSSEESLKNSANFL